MEYGYQAWSMVIERSCLDRFRFRGSGVLEV